MKIAPLAAAGCAVVAIAALAPERFQGLFDRADGDEDGALTKEELKQTASATGAVVTYLAHIVWVP